jgi:hypothetical protein
MDLSSDGFFHVISGFGNATLGDKAEVHLSELFITTYGKKSESAMRTANPANEKVIADMSTDSLVKISGDAKKFAMVNVEADMKDNKVEVLSRKDEELWKVSHTVNGGVGVALSTDGKALAVKKYDAGVMTTEVYSLDNGNKVTMMGSPIDGGFALDVSADGKVVAVSTEDKVAVYTYSSSAWKMRGSALSVKATSISLSTDGKRLAIGNADMAEVTVYDNANKMVGQKLSNKDKTTMFGYSVSLNGAGDHVAIGYPGAEKMAGGSAMYILSMDGKMWKTKGKETAGAFAGDLAGTIVVSNEAGNWYGISHPGHSKVDPEAEERTVKNATIGKVTVMSFKEVGGDGATIAAVVIGFVFTVFGNIGAIRYFRPEGTGDEEEEKVEDEE